MNQRNMDTTIYVLDDATADLILVCGSGATPDS